MLYREIYLLDDPFLENIENLLTVADDFAVIFLTFETKIFRQISTIKVIMCFPQVVHESKVEFKPNSYFLLTFFYIN